MAVVDNAKFHDAILEYREVKDRLDMMVNLHPDPNDRTEEVSDLIYWLEGAYRRSKNKVGEFFLKLADYWKNFRSEYRDYYGSRGIDMISLGIDYMSRNIMKYDSETENPFNYFSMACKSGFHQIKEKYDNEDKLISPMTRIEHCSGDIDQPDHVDIEYISRKSLNDEIAERKSYEKYKQQILLEIMTGESEDEDDCSDF